MNAPATRKPNELAQFRGELDTMRSQLGLVLPPHITIERLARLAINAVQQNPDLLRCNRKSLYAAIMRSAQLGLEPDGVLGQAYLIPFKGVVQFIPGYKGLITLARNTGEVSSIRVEAVFHGDHFRVVNHQDPAFEHEPDIDGERTAAKVRAFYALARFRDGSTHFEWMSKREVDAIRERSPGKNSEPWRVHYVEMGKKTVIRRLCKFLPMDVQRAAARQEAFEERGEVVTIPEWSDEAADMNAGTLDPPAIESQPPASPMDVFERELEAGEMEEA